MDKITVNIPKIPQNKWKATFTRNNISGGAYSRNSPDLLYRLIERRLLASPQTIKRRLFVNYGGGYHNDGIYANVRDFMYALICFMEDYVSSYFFKIKEKKYYPI